jgi:hypothetical protein
MQGITFSSQFHSKLLDGSKIFTTRFSPRFDGQKFNISGVDFSLRIVATVKTTDIFKSIDMGIPKPIQHGFSTHDEMRDYWNKYIFSKSSFPSIAYVYRIYKI